MPLYEYHCESCDRHFEKRRAIKEADTRVECPDCAGESVTRKLSLFVAFTKSDSGMASFGGSGGGCACGGACACGGHSAN